MDETSGSRKNCHQMEKFTVQCPRGVFEFALNEKANWLPTRDNCRSQIAYCVKATRHFAMSWMPVQWHWQPDTHGDTTVCLRNWLPHCKDGTPSLICRLLPYGVIWVLNSLLEGGTHITIPPDILPTPLVPDITIQNSAQQNLTLVDLTVPFEQNTQVAVNTKIAMYEHLKEEIYLHSKVRWTVVTLEVGNSDNASKLKSLCSAVVRNKYVRKLKGGVTHAYNFKPYTYEFRFDIFAN